MRKITGRLLTLGFIVVLAGAQEAKAGRWSLSPGTDGGPHLFVYHHDDSDYSHLSNTAPQVPEPRDVPYSVVIHNSSNVVISYKLNDQAEPKIKPGESFKWTIYGSKNNPAVFSISYNNSKQQINNQALAVFSDNDFRFVGSGNQRKLDLFKLDRTIWRYNGGAWEKRGSGKWVLLDLMGHEVAVAKEVGVTERYVELYDANLDYVLQIYNDGLVAKGGNNKVQHFDNFTLLYPGRWQK